MAPLRPHSTQQPSQFATAANKMEREISMPWVNPEPVTRERVPVTIDGVEVLSLTEEEEADHRLHLDKFRQQRIEAYHASLLRSACVLDVIETGELGVAAD